MFTPRSGRDSIASLADDECEFRLVVGLGGILGQDNRVAWTDNRSLQLEEDSRSCRHSHFRFDCMVAVVEANGEDTRRSCKWRMQTNILEFVLGTLSQPIDRSNASGDDRECVAVAGGEEIDDELSLVQQRAWTNSTTIE